MRFLFFKYKTEEFNIADWITAYRIITAPIVFLLIFFSNQLIFSIFLTISFLSDAIDGFVARRLKIVSSRGAYLDSIGDVITVVVAIIGVFWFRFDFVKEQVVWLAIIIGLYFLQLGLAYWRYGRPSSFHTYAVKLAAVMQALFLLALLFFDYLDWLFKIVVVLSVIEAIEEIILIFVLKKWETDVKGLYWVLKRKKKK
jgi:CDP-diacylglycerol--glycerol-3-phosphate 3-phosphatidyltransferase